VAGEHLCSSREFRAVCHRRGALDGLQPNGLAMGTGVGHHRGRCGSGELAAAHGLGFAPHFMTELHVHVAAALHQHDVPGVLPVPG